MEVVLPPALKFTQQSPSFINPASTFSSSSPSRCGDGYFTAPCSPRRMAELYRDFRWDETAPEYVVEDEFAFDLNRDSEESLLSAAELFEGGKIKSVMPPPDLLHSGQQNGCYGADLSSSSRISTISERQRSSDVDDSLNSDRFEVARGRERGSGLMKSRRSSRRTARSLSPLRDRQWEEMDLTKNDKTTNQSSQDLPKSFPSSSSVSSKIWRFTDFLLFRSASEGRARYEDGMKFTSPFKKNEDVKNISFRATEPIVSGRRKKVQVSSAHETHYTAKKAISEDLKKKTFLPYRKNIFGFGTFTQK